METAKSMLKKFDEYIDRNERNFKNAMAYQEQPITVVESEDINNWIRDRSAEYEEYRKNLSDVHGDIDGLRKMTSSYGDTAKEVNDTLKHNVELLTYFKKKLEASAPEPKGFGKFKAWWNSRKVFWWRVGIFCCKLGATVLVGLYCYCWSDDAWARRAYDAAATVDGEDNPGRYYQWARETFDRKGRKAAKDRILRLEDKARELNGGSR